MDSTVRLKWCTCRSVWVHRDAVQVAIAWAASHIGAITGWLGGRLRRSGRGETSLWRVGLREMQ